MCVKPVEPRSEPKCQQLISFLSGAAEQEQSVCQRVLWGRQRVRREREGGAQLSVYRGECRLRGDERRSRNVKGKKNGLCVEIPPVILYSSFLFRAVSPTRGQCVAATGRPTGTTVSSTETPVWLAWRSRWPTMDTARVRAATTQDVAIWPRAILVSQ